MACESLIWIQTYQINYCEQKDKIQRHLTPLQRDYPYCQRLHWKSPFKLDHAAAIQETYSGRGLILFIFSEMQISVAIMPRINSEMQVGLTLHAKGITQRRGIPVKQVPDLLTRWTKCEIFMSHPNKNQQLAYGYQLFSSY